MHQQLSVQNKSIPFGEATLHIATAPLLLKNSSSTQSRRAYDTEIEKNLQQFAKNLQNKSTEPLFQFLFGTHSNDSLLPQKWPLSFLQGDGSDETSPFSTQTLALSGISPLPIMDGARVAGYHFETADARYCILGNLHADHLSASRTDQAQAVFEKMERLLQQADMNFTHTVRTWIYLRDLLDWYDEFNAVRTRFFQERGVFEKMVPASTGIGAFSPAGEAIETALIAIAPKNEQVQITSIPSPLQCPAIDYKSSFARAIEITHPNSRLLCISGTASIAPEGETLYVGDCEKQIDLTMKVIHEILKSRKMDWSNTVRAIAYFKHAADIPLLENYAREHHIPSLPVAIVHAAVCRDDLLFEMELDAALPC
jgi:enamine deaminase RidA (YjgF/YER057c/UK114 family)